ncbi:MAG: DNA polymerase III subunit delta [Corynebacteriales bacterium]|nr:DNA polymerase III subunit delta [Mycobacteriales bacterium]
MTTYLLTGDEEYLVSRAIAEIVARTQAHDPDCERVELPGAQLAAGALAETFSPSLFASARVVIIRDGQDVPKALHDSLLAHADTLAESITLVVAHAGGAKGKALLEALRKKGALVQPCLKITKAKERAEFIRAEVKRAGGRTTADAVELIADAVGGNLRELANVCAQLVADSDGVVDIDAVRRYHSGRAEVTGFTVADAVMAGDEAEALAATRWAVGIGVDPVLIADALADGVRTVARVSSAGRGNAYQLASQLGMPAWKIERAQRTARGWSAPALIAAMRVAAELNGAVKGGSEDRVFALERSIGQVIALRSQFKGNS